MHTEPGWRVQVAGTQEALATRAEMARSLMARMVGLLDRRVLEEGEALILTACRSIHTCFMRFAIDAVFVDRQWGVVAIARALPPWRMTSPVWQASAVIELPAGTAQRVQLAVGDRLVVEQVPGYKRLDKP